ncbi:MAG: glycosyltransferase [Planctomycetota bacterium]|nr:glycosyltransferase [Planctomycetota bacterium]
MENAPSLPIKVSVLVDLIRSPNAGGHVKSWERFAESAIRQAGTLDLTVHFLGDKEEVVPLADNVRFRLHPPRFSTKRFGFLSHVPDHTDLAFYHPGLAKHLVTCDVIHTTDAFFTFARTALKVSRRHSIPLVNSIHTDTPSYTRVYTAQTVERVFGRGLASRLLLNGLKVHLRAERYMLRRLAGHQRHSAFVLVSTPDDCERMRQEMPADRVGMLRRGIDTAFFAPAKRDRAWLQQRFGVSPDQAVVLFVGRLSRGKNVLVLMEAVSRLAAEGLPICLVCAGQGDERQVIVERLGRSACCPGVVLGEDLARLYASADLFAMPSEIEVFCNVVQEAMASGLPTVLAQRGGMGRLIAPDETGIIVGDRSPESWAGALKTLCTDAEHRAAMGRAARAYAEKELPSWDDVLAKDLLPIWQSAAALKTRGGDGTGRP